MFKSWNHRLNRIRFSKITGPWYHKYSVSTKRRKNVMLVYFWRWINNVLQNFWFRLTS
jgi:hypothetical protein